MSDELYLTILFTIVFGWGLCGWWCHSELLKDFEEYKEIACDLLAKYKNDINELKKEHSDE